MDIARYIGLFLLKNNFCYIHGLGNLEIRKKPASYDGMNLQPVQYDVVLTPTGSIDDSLANFIATNEQTSISKASNALREFSISARQQLQEGREVIIPGLGKFLSQNGKIQFITEPQFQHTPPPIPMAQIAKREEEPVKKQYDDAASRTGATVNWGKIIIMVLLVAAVAAAAVFGIRYLPSSGEEPAATDTVSTTVVEEPLPPPAAPVLQDTAAADTSSMMMRPDSVQVSQPVISAGVGQYRMVLNQYDRRTTAEKRLSQLRSFGNNVELIARDSSSFYIVMPVSVAAADTVRVMDSLRRLFNPKGISIYR